MQNILELLTSNPLYMVGAGIIGLVLIIFLLKKVFKIMIIIIVLVLGYGGYLYMQGDDPIKEFKKKIDESKSTMDGIDKATNSIRKEALDKVIDDVQKKLDKKK